MKNLNVKIISPDKIIFQGDCSSITFPGTDGYFGIMPGCENSAYVMTEGKITVKKAEKPEEFEIKSGTLTCKDNKIIIIL